MPRRLWIAALGVWPGLAQIWSGQEVVGLVLAALFAATLNLALVARFVWTESFAPEWVICFAALAVSGWTASLGYTLWWLWLRHPSGHRAEIDQLFRHATEAYLQGRYHEARQCLEQVVALDDHDADALMQLGTLFVRTEQLGIGAAGVPPMLGTGRGGQMAMGDPAGVGPPRRGSVGPRIMGVGVKVGSKPGRPPRRGGASTGVVAFRGDRRQVDSFRRRSRVQ